MVEHLRAGADKGSRASKSSAKSPKTPAKKKGKEPAKSQPKELDRPNCICPELYRPQYNRPVQLPPGVKIPETIDKEKEMELIRRMDPFTLSQIKIHIQSPTYPAAGRLVPCNECEPGCGKINQQLARQRGPAGASYPVTSAQGVPAGPGNCICQSGQCQAQTCPTNVGKGKNY